jgi:sec-independent protein translocase protein TatA
MLPLLIGGLGTPELLLVLAIVILVFGASKLPELARGSGRALRIFKAETQGLVDDDKDGEDQKTASQHELEARQAAERDALEARQTAERDTPVTRTGDLSAERRDDPTA